MNQLERKRQGARIAKLRDKWESDLGLGHWKIRHDICHGELPEGLASSSSDRRVVATTSAQFQYMQAVIEWNAHAMLDLDDKELEKCFVHDLMHVRLHEMREYRSRCGRYTDIDREERFATELTQAFLWVERAARRRGVRAPPHSKRRTRRRR